MKRRFLALAMTLVMVFSLLPATLATVTAVENDEYLDFSTFTPVDTNADDGTFSVNGNTATLQTTPARAATYDALNLTGIFTSAENVDEHVTQIITITELPAWKGSKPAAAGDMYWAAGYFNTLSRNSGTSKLEEGKTDYLMYSINGLSNQPTLTIINPVAGTRQDISLAGKVTLGTAFELTTVWHFDNFVSFYIDDVLVGTYEGFTYAHTADETRENYLSIGYSNYGNNDNTAYTQNIDLTVSNIEIAHGHTVPADDSDCTTAVVCPDCGKVLTPAEPAHVFDRKVPAEEYKKEDGVYYLSCSCGKSSAGFAEEATFSLSNLYLDLSTATAVDTNTEDGTFSVNGNTATLQTTPARAATYDALNLTGIFTSAENVDEHVTQIITITELPAWKGSKPAAAGDMYWAAGYFNTLSRNSGTSKLEEGKTDYLMYSINGLSNQPTLTIINPVAVTRQDISLAGKVALGTAFELTTVWHFDNFVSFYIDDVLVGTYEGFTYAHTADETRENYLSIGYSNYGNNDNTAYTQNIDLTVSNIEIAHGHSGGGANCEERATCVVCGAEYGELGDHIEGSAATCTAKSVCAVCTKEYGIPADHNPDENGVCIDCTNESGYYDLRNAIEGKNVEGTFNLSKYGASVQADVVTLLGANGYGNYAAAVKGAVGTSDIAFHVSQTITIIKMPVFDTAYNRCSYASNGYYNNLRRNENQDYVSYSIFPDKNGILSLWIYDNAEWKEVALNRELGVSFRLSTVWHTDNSISFYCDGTLLGTYKNATVTSGGGAHSNHNSAFTMGYSSIKANEAAYGTGAVDLTVSNVVFSNGHYNPMDVDCTTAGICVCGVATVATEGHVAPEDIDNCTTDVRCSNPGCSVVISEGHTLTHVDRVEPDGATPGMKEHWYCQTDDAYFADEAGTQKVNREDLIISSVVDVEDGKATVKDDFAGVVNGSEGQVELEVPTASGVELPAAVLDALQTKGQPLVITTSGGKVTLNQDFLAAIKNTTGDSGSLFVEVKAGATLESAQETELAKKGTVKEVISAEMLAGGADLHDFTGTVTIEIPFELAPNTTANDYQLWYVDDNGTSSKQIEATFADGKMTATLEHFSNYAIVTTAAEPVQGNGTITQDGGKATATVTGTYYDGLSAGDAFSVVVEWENLSFNYMAANTWDPETHTHTGGGWEEATGSVTVVNHSNIDVTVTVTKEDVGAGKNLGVAFLADDGLELTVDTVTDNLDAGTTENTGDLADKFVVEFAPKGTLTEGDKDVTLATITVTITKYVP